MSYHITYPAYQKARFNAERKHGTNMFLIGILLILVILSFYLWKNPEISWVSQSCNGELIVQLTNNLIQNLQNDIGLIKSVTIFCDDLISNLSVAY